MSPRVLSSSLGWALNTHFQVCWGPWQSATPYLDLSLQIAQGQAVLEAAVKPNAGGRWVPKDTGTRPETK